MDITRRAAVIYFVGSLLILALKYAAYFQTGSTAVLSDAMESIVNVLAAGVALMVMRAVAAPADEEHPYGHGKLEYFSATFEGGLITFAGIMIAYEAVRALYLGQAPRNLDLGILISAGAGVANLLLGYFLLVIAKRHRSEALTASAKHVFSDVWSTAGSLVGLGLVKMTGLAFFDPLAALLVSVNLARSGYRIVRRSMGALIDEVEPRTLEDLSTAFQKNKRPGVIDIHLTKVIRSGRFHHVDSHLVVPEYWRVSETHELAESFERDVFKTYPFEGEVNFHLDPCNRDYCEICEVESCPVRQRPFKGPRVFSPASLVRRPRRDEAP